MDWGPRRAFAVFAAETHCLHLVRKLTYFVKVSLGQNYAKRAGQRSCHLRLGTYEQQSHSKALESLFTISFMTLYNEIKWLRRWTLAGYLIICIRAWDRALPL